MSAQSNIYKEKKLRLEMFAEEIASVVGTDKPMQNMMINDYTDNLVRELDFAMLQERISDKQFVQYVSWLQNHSCTLHMK